MTKEADLSDLCLSWMTLDQWTADSLDTYLGDFPFSLKSNFYVANALKCIFIKAVCFSHCKYIFI